MRPLLLILPLLLMLGCTAKRPDDAWRYNTATAYKYAEQYFLEGKDSLAVSEFREAEKHAKQSADVIPLARLYLSICALNKAVLLDNGCASYLEVAPYADEPELYSYHALLTGTLENDQLRYLPERYRAFAGALLKQESASIRRLIGQMQPLSSKMIAASLAREHIDDAIMESIIQEASHFGYKRALIAWMTLLASTTADRERAEQLLNRLQIMTRSER